jgi:hypothetical protein
VQAVIGAQTASQFLTALTGVLVFLGMSRYWILAVAPTRIVVPDAGKMGMGTARRVIMELPRSTRLSPATGRWHRIPAGSKTFRVHGRFYKDIETADSVVAAA